MGPSENNLIDDRFKIFSGSASPELTERICGHLGVQTSQQRGNAVPFAPGEQFAQIIGSLH